ncbi:21438_t:CDS:1, partial [Racocetra persica]
MLKSLRKLRKNNNDTLCLHPGCQNKVGRGRNGIDFNYCSPTCQLASFQSSNTEPVNDYIVASEIYDVDVTDTQQWSQLQTNPVILESTSGSSQNSNDISQWSRNSFRSLQQSPGSSSYSRPPQQGYTSTNDYYASSKQPGSNFSMWLNLNADQDNLDFSPFGQTSDSLPEEKV